MKPAEGLQQLYRQRLEGLSEVIASLPDMVADDPVVRSLAETPALSRYRIDRVLELTNSLLHDEKEVTIIAVLEALHSMQSQKQRLQELFSSQQNLRREVEEQLEQLSARRRDSPVQHSYASSKELIHQEFDHSAAEKLMAVKLKNVELQREIMVLNNQLLQQTKQPVDVEQQKLELEVEQLKELREYLLGQLKKMQTKFSEKQLLCDSLTQKQGLIEQQNCALAAGNRRLTAQLEQTKQESNEYFNKSTRQENSKLSQQLDELHLKHRAQVEALNDTIGRLRSSLEDQRNSLHREIRHAKETHNQLTRNLQDRTSQLRRVQEETDRVRQRQDKLAFEVKLKSQQLQRCEAELEMKRKEINKLTSIFEEERRGYEIALKQQDSRRVERRRHNHTTTKLSHFSQQPQSPARRTLSKFGQRLDTQEFEEVNEQIARLQNELNSLRNGFHAAKQRTKQSVEENIHQLRRGILTLRRAIEKIIRLTQEETSKMIRELEAKARHLMLEERNDHKAKMERVKQLCDQRLALVSEKARIEQEERQEDHIQLQRRLAEKESQLKLVQSQNHKTRQIIEASESLEQSYSTLLKEHEELNKKYQLLLTSNGSYDRATTRSPQTRSQSPQPHINGYRPYSWQKEKQQPQDRRSPVDKTAEARATDLSRTYQREKSLHNSGILIKSKMDNMGAEQHPKETSPKKFHDPVDNRQDHKRADDSLHFLNNSRRVQLQNGFNELQDEIEAIIQRRNKRVIKYLK